MGRAPQTHRVLTFKEQFEIAFDGLWTIGWVQSGEDVWFQVENTLSDNLRQDGRPRDKHHQSAFQSVPKAALTCSC